jgi:hypothetical protein
MTNNFKKLRELTANKIDTNNLENTILEKILSKVLTKINKRFVFNNHKNGSCQDDENHYEYAELSNGDKNYDMSPDITGESCLDCKSYKSCIEGCEYHEVVFYSGDDTPKHSDYIRERTDNGQSIMMSPDKQKIFLKLIDE